MDVKEEAAIKLASAVDSQCQQLGSKAIRTSVICYPALSDDLSVLASETWQLMPT